MNGYDATALYNKIRTDRFLWINLTDENLHAAIDAAYDAADTRVVGMISYQLGHRAGRAAEREHVAALSREDRADA